MVKKVYKVYSDGGARGNPGPAACAFVVFENGHMVFQGKKFLGEKTNNFAEYSAVVAALDWLTKNIKDGKAEVYYYVDSELVVNQLSGRYKVKSKNLLPLVLKAKKKIDEFAGKIKFFSVKRENNKLSDKLVNEVLDENL